MRTKVILVPLFGIPGSGKGTVVKTLERLSTTSSNIQIASVEMGTYFRKEAEKNNVIRQIIADGNLLPDSLADKTFQELFNETAANVLLKQELKDKIIILIDGYPRTMKQWKNFLSYQDSKTLYVLPVFLELDEVTVLERSKIRRICPQCGTTFSIKERQICPKCQTKGQIRPDDLTMAHRIKVFKKETLPVIIKAHETFCRQFTVNSQNLRTAALEIWAFFQNL